MSSAPGDVESAKAMLDALNGDSAFEAIQALAIHAKPSTGIS